MSLKAFHIVFIAASILLALGFGGWSLLNFRDAGRTLDLVFGAGSILSAVALFIYGRMILKKLKHISFI